MVQGPETTKKKKKPDHSEGNILGINDHPSFINNFYCSYTKQLWEF